MRLLHLPATPNSAESQWSCTNALAKILASHLTSRDHAVYPALSQSADPSAWPMWSRQPYNVNLDSHRPSLNDTEVSLFLKVTNDHGL